MIAERALTVWGISLADQRILRSALDGITSMSGERAGSFHSRFGVSRWLSGSLPMLELMVLRQ
jgi:hypothetical protein